MGETALEEEVRYWDRIGMYVTEEFAAEWIERLGTGGHVLDEEIEEFVPVEASGREIPTAEELRAEIGALFTAPPNQGDLSEENLAILALMNFERKRKNFIVEQREAGLELDEAKVAYETAKGVLVRDALGLPEPEPESEEDDESDSSEEE